MVDKRKNYRLLNYLTLFISVVSIFILISVIFFIVLESLPFIKSEGIVSLLKPGKWKPIANSPSFSIFNLIAASLYIFLISIIIALPISLGTALFINFYIPEKYRDAILKFIGILAGIPSVVMGFIGLTVVVKFIERYLSLSSGESVLAGGVVVSMMVIPFILSTISETVSIIRKNHITDSDSLGISTEYFIREIAMKKIGRSVGIGLILAFSRVIGETMAVMMVIGNAPMFPKLLGKSQTIPSLIALEMGMAEVGSIHYSALFSSGLILLITITLVNIVIQIFRNRGIHNED